MVLAAGECEDHLRTDFQANVAAPRRRRKIPLASVKRVGQGKGDPASQPVRPPVRWGGAAGVLASRRPSGL